MVVESLITSLGCHVKVCSSGEECLGALSEQKYRDSPFGVVRAASSPLPPVHSCRSSRPAPFAGRVAAHQLLRARRSGVAGLGAGRHDGQASGGEAPCRLPLGERDEDHHGLRARTRGRDHHCPRSSGVRGPARLCDHRASGQSRGGNGRGVSARRPYSMPLIPLTAHHSHACHSLRRVLTYWEKPVTAKRLQDLLEEHVAARK